MKQILFVDDEVNILEGLQRMLFPLQREYKMAFANSGAEALEAMSKTHFDVIVSDMRMPGMNGAELLGEVKRLYPDTLRFVLTGQSDSEAVFRTVSEAHQILSKPCKPKILKEYIDKAFALRAKMENALLKSLVAQVGALPPLPEVYQALCEELESPEGSIANVGKIIERDLSMTAKILQLVNSAFFSLPREVTSATQAASLLGFGIIKGLVLLTGIFSDIDKNKMPPDFSIDALWRHSSLVGGGAEAICQLEQAPRDLREDAYTAGLLHDIGKLVLASACPEDYQFVQDYVKVNEVSVYEAEEEILGASHAEVGGYLLGIWGLPDRIVEAVTYHHRPADLPSSLFSPLTSVHAANAFVARKSIEAEGGRPLEMDQSYLEKLGLAAHIDDWERAFQEIATSKDAKQE